MITYVAGFYMTILLHFTPLQMSGSILDFFFCFGYRIIDHLLLSMFTYHQNRILDMNSQQDIMTFIKDELVDLSLKEGNLSDILLSDSLVQLLKTIENSFVLEEEETI